MEGSSSKPSYDGYVYVLVVDTPVGPQEPMVFVETTDAHEEFRRQVDTICIEDGYLHRPAMDVEAYRENHLYWTDGISSVRLYNPLLIRKDV